MPVLGLVQPDREEDWRERACRAGWRDVKIIWVLLVVIVLIAVL